MDFSDTDTASLRLIIQLQREDLDQLGGSRKRKRDEADIPDTELAIEASKAELKKLERLVTDRSMGESIARAVSKDGTAITAKMVAEDQSAKDRKLAQGLEAHPDRPLPKAPTQGPVLQPELLAKLEVMYGCSPDISKKLNGDVRQLRRCVSCQENHNFIEVARCPCSHEYCRECLAGLFRASITDESLFPPRCCKQPIPIEVNRIFLPSKLVGEFKAKKLEFETPNRTYCHDPKCSTFVPAQFVRDNVAHCVRCRKRTCSTCKGAAHIGECPHDPAMEEFLRVARTNGWQQCSKCHRMLELTHGCYHMTCPCGHHFCYRCGQRWKTCQCAVWDEARLVERANAVAQRNAQRNPVPARPQGPAWQQIVQQAREHIEVNHECDHEEWRRLRGANECEECGDRLPYFIYECQQCQLLACRRCRFNRL